MMRRKWIGTALLLIAAGIAGAAFYGFKFDHSRVDYRKEWTFGADEVRQLKVRLDSSAATIDFVPSADGKNTVTVEGKADRQVVDRVLEENIANGSLSIDLSPPWKWFDFSLDFSPDRQHLTVALTEQAAQALKSIDVKSDSGSLTANGASSGRATFASDSGSIRINGYQGGQLTLKSDSGSIRAEKIVSPLEAATDSGSLSVQHLTGAAKLTSDSGSISLLKDDATGADIKADSGSVHVQLPGSFGGSFDLRSDSGSIRAPEAKGTSPEIVKVRTDSGSIRIVE